MTTSVIARVVLLLAAAGFQLAGCTDPGCIRNSECDVPYSCIGQRCVVSVEAGLAQPEDDAGVERVD